ncbi:unnamed protein product, partial [Didymodactylos carnosus]
INKRLISIEQRIDQLEYQNYYLEQSVNKRERHSRQFNLRFIGLKEQEGGEMTNRIVECAQKAAINLHTEDIELSHPIGASKEGVSRPVIARFLSRVKLRSFLLQRKKVKDLTSITIYED